MHPWPSFCQPQKVPHSLSCLTGVTRGQGTWALDYMACHPSQGPANGLPPGIWILGADPVGAGPVVGHCRGPILLLAHCLVLWGCRKKCRVRQLVAVEQPWVVAWAGTALGMGVAGVVGRKQMALHTGGSQSACWLRLHGLATAVAVCPFPAAARWCPPRQHQVHYPWSPLPFLILSQAKASQAPSKPTHRVSRVICCCLGRCSHPLGGCLPGLWPNPPRPDLRSGQCPGCLMGQVPSLGEVATKEAHSKVHCLPGMGTAKLQQEWVQEMQLG